MDEGGFKVKDLKVVMKALHMKFVWRLHSKDNLWSKFFKEKYVNGEHLATIIRKQKGSISLMALCKVASKMQDHSYTHIGSGNASFWFDNQLGTGSFAGD